MIHFRNIKHSPQVTRAKNDDCAHEKLRRADNSNNKKIFKQIDQFLYDLC